MNAQVVTAIIAASASVVTLIGTLAAQYLGRRATSKQLDRTLGEQRTRTLNERFSAAADQLGSDKPAIRLAGVYAMAGLADDWPENRQTCVDVLCAYMRMPYRPDPGDEAPEPERIAFRASREVRHTVIRVIAAHLKDDAAVSWQGLTFNFWSVVFDGCDFRDAMFSGGKVSFYGAMFSGGKADFQRATFSGGRVDFRSATFSGGRADFTGAKFSGGEVDFSGAEFSGSEVSFYEAKFSDGKVDFGGAEFSGSTVIFFGAEFSGGKVSFGVAGFSGGKVDFVRAAFSGGKVDFVRAVFYGGEVDFRSATFSGRTVSVHLFCTNQRKKRSPGPGWPEKLQYRLYSSQIRFAVSSRSTSLSAVSCSCLAHAAAQARVIVVSRRLAAMSTLQSMTTLIPHLGGLPPPSSLLSP